MVAIASGPLPERLRVLLLEDDPHDAALITQELRQSFGPVTLLHASATPASSSARCASSPSTSSWSIACCPRSAARRRSGWRAASPPTSRRSSSRDPSTSRRAAGMIKAGAADYVLKDRLARLGPVDPPGPAGPARARASTSARCEALRQSEERYALAVRGANDGLWDWDLVRSEVYYSPRWKAMLGYDEGAVGARPEDWLDRVHPDDLPRLRHALHQHLTGVVPYFECEHRMRAGDGGWRWMLSRGPGRAGRVGPRLADGRVADRRGPAQAGGGAAHPRRPARRPDRPRQPHAARWTGCGWPWRATAGGRGERWPSAA